jgi:hypothetical protein
MALELVYGANCWRDRHRKTIPVDLEGFRGQVWPKNDPKSTPWDLPGSKLLPKVPTWTPAALTAS